ncbi:MAG: VOC family protein [Streptosporangiaceae bacterium]
MNPDELARFRCALLDVQVDSNIGEGQFIVLSATAEGLVAGFQQVPEAKSGKNRLHLDPLRLSPANAPAAARAESDARAGADRWLTKAAASSRRYLRHDRKPAAGL